ncbi:MAG: futalosine hydrolase [Phycisphaera sp.]|nr:MAG: futalosine hydrolase [Phycisphaera sp.]
MGDSIETLLVLAAANEVTAVSHAFDDRLAMDVPEGTPIRLSELLWTIQSGIGKSNAAAKTAAVLATNPPKRVISLGIAGALPGGGLQIGDAVLASRSVFADEGVDTPAGFIDCRSMGFPIYAGDDGEGLPPDQAVRDRLLPVLDGERVVATVSVCSGRDDLAERIRRRTGASAESMEGAAVLLACMHAGVPAAEVRVISNTAGDREHQIWDIGRAMARLGEVARSFSDIDFD